MTCNDNKWDDTINVTIFNQQFDNKIIFLPQGGRVAIKAMQLAPRKP